MNVARSILVGLLVPLLSTAEYCLAADLVEAAKVDALVLPLIEGRLDRRRGGWVD